MQTEVRLLGVIGVEQLVEEVTHRRRRDVATDDHVLALATQRTIHSTRID